MRRAALSALSLLLLATPAGAQYLGGSITRTLERYDLEAVAPVVRRVLDQGAPGDVERWDSRRGHGRVVLLSGGARQGQQCGRVRVTSDVRGREARHNLRFCRAPNGGWRQAS